MGYIFPHRRSSLQKYARPVDLPVSHIIYTCLSVCVSTCIYESTDVRLSVGAPCSCFCILPDLAGDAAFLANDIRVQKGLDGLGCLGDMGWYCVRASLWAYDFEKPVSVTAHAGTHSFSIVSPGTEDLVESSSPNPLQRSSHECTCRLNLRDTNCDCC